MPGLEGPVVVMRSLEVSTPLGVGGRGVRFVMGAELC